MSTGLTTFIYTSFTYFLGFSSQKSTRKAIKGPKSKPVKPKIRVKNKIN